MFLLTERLFYSTESGPVKMHVIITVLGKQNRPLCTETLSPTDISSLFGRDDGVCDITSEPYFLCPTMDRQQQGGRIAAVCENHLSHTSALLNQTAFLRRVFSFNFF